MRVQIASMETIHISQVAALEATCFSTPWSEKLLEEELDRDTTAYFVALDETGTVLGYAGFYTVLDEGCITNVAVDPTCRRQGVGQGLLQALLKTARERAIAYMTLEVRESNGPAICLYQTQGFQVVGRRKQYYEKPREDAILMTIQLES